MRAAMTEYYIPTKTSETELVEKRSRFLGHVWHVESEAEARARIEETRKKHYDARHNCWCYRLRKARGLRADEGRRGETEFYVSDRVEDFERTASLFLQEDLRHMARRIDIERY